MNESKVIVAPILAWLVPGLGHLYLGRRGKALLFFVTILALFVAGHALASWHAVSWSREPLWFLGEAGALLPTLVSAAITSDLPWRHLGEHHHAGLLYATVAGLLNVVVAMDAFGIALVAARGDRS